jgi:5'-nucleotidase
VTRPLIFLTNDDGIDSPGLAASACALDPLGDLLIVAPHVQMSGMGRSMPGQHTGRLTRETVRYCDRSWPAYGADASPALAVQHAVLEIADRKPVLAVSGINYGENVGVAITISGTVGAALESATQGIPSLAVSLEVDFSQHYNNDPLVKFDASMEILRTFAEMWLNAQRLPDVDVLKIDIPAGATPDTPWRITRLERRPYYLPVAPIRESLEDDGAFGYRMAPRENFDPRSDAAALAEGVIAVTPLSLDMTSRIAPDTLREMLTDNSVETPHS